MRTLAALGIMLVAVVIALVAWPLVAVASRLRRLADRVRGTTAAGPASPQWPGPSIHDDQVALAVVTAHERDLRLGLARVH